MSNTSKFLPKTFDFCGVICSPLGRRATVDTIVFRQQLSVCPERNFCFWIDRNIEVWVYKLNQIWVIEVSVFSLPKFYNGRSSSLINDYHDVLLNLNAHVNLELKKRLQSLVFDAFAAEIIRLDVFVDLRFKSKSNMLYFYENAKNVIIPALPSSTDYDKTHYWHDNDNLDNSTEYLKIYHKEKNGRDKYKLRVEASLQNYNRLKPIDDFLERIDQPENSYAVKTIGNDSRIKSSYRVYQNRYQSNAFTLLNQYAINSIFEFVAGKILPDKTLDN